MFTTWHKCIITQIFLIVLISSPNLSVSNFNCPIILFLERGLTYVLLKTFFLIRKTSVMRLLQNLMIRSERRLENFYEIKATYRRYIERMKIKLRFSYFVRKNYGIDFLRNRCLGSWNKFHQHSEIWDFFFF